jgi:hypothetical protein
MAGDLKALSDDELLRRLSALLGQSRRIEWQLVTHIGEVDARRLFAREACESMFVYCTDVLHLSEHEAYLRIAAARAARAHPVLLTMLSDGRLHLSGIAKLAPHLTMANREVLLAQATHRSKRQIEVLVADLAPRPDVPASIRKLPARAATVPVVAVAPVAAMRHSVDQGLELGPDRVPAAPSAPPVRHVDGRSTRPDVDPLGSGRFKVQFTASAAFCEKLERLKALMLSSVARWRPGPGARDRGDGGAAPARGPTFREDGDAAKDGWPTRIRRPHRLGTSRLRCAGSRTPPTTGAAPSSAPAEDGAAHSIVSSSITACRGQEEAIGPRQHPPDVPHPQRASGREGLRRGGDGTLPKVASATRMMNGGSGGRRRGSVRLGVRGLRGSAVTTRLPLARGPGPGRGSRENGTFHRGMGPRDGSRIIRSTMPLAWLRVTMAANVVMSGQSGNGTSSAASSPSFAW